MYRLEVLDKAFRTTGQALEGAMPPIPGHEGEEHAFGIVGMALKGLPMPGTGGSYVVERLDGDTVRVVAYLDPYGRAFTVDDALTAPPAHEPSLTFELDEERSAAEGTKCGLVFVYENGEAREMAQFRRDRGYTLYDSWYRFGARESGIPYNEALARAYLAFVHRASLGAPAVPARGIRGVSAHLLSAHLHNEGPLKSMRGIVADVRAADADPVLEPPALVRCLAGWLIDAGLETLSDLNDDQVALRLVSTVRYANTYYVGVEGDRSVMSERTVWALEAALNRYRLVAEALGESATLASEADCLRWDAYLMETVALQHPDLDRPVGAPKGAPGGEWDVRCAASAVIERLRLPVRVTAALQFDASAGALALNATVPDEGLMPRWVWREGAGGHAGARVEAALQERGAQARRYALHVGLVLAAAAFEASPSVLRVDLALRPFADEATSKEGEEAGEFPVESRVPAYAQVSFDRAAYEGFGRFEGARAADPFPLYRSCGAVFDIEAADAFAYVDALPTATLRKELPETREMLLADRARLALGSDDSRGVRISFDAARRRMAESLADLIAGADSAAEAIRIVRSAQEQASSAGDDRAFSSCTRLMAALAEGDVDMGDQNAVVSRYLGEDRCLVALGRAKSLVDQDPSAAVAALIDGVREASALDGFVDGAQTVFRAFDSYSSRVLYNRARAGAGCPERAAADAGKRVELVSDSFYLCHLEIVRLLEQSFDRTDEAIRYGQRAVELAPATLAGYRQLGRVYMLVGDMDNAARVLQEGLRAAVRPSDIAMAYYQLAYVLWKAGRAQAGATCYLKSMAVSSVAAVQAAAELRELVDETGAQLVPREQVDEELARAGVPVAPTSEVLDALDEAAVAATDANLFPVAHNLLNIRLHYRPDDALANVFRSLGG